MLLLLPKDVLRIILAKSDDLSKMVLRETCRVLYLLIPKLTASQKYKAVDGYIYTGPMGAVLRFLYYRRKDVIASRVEYNFSRFQLKMPSF
jgi:hypothetical protein